MKSVCGMFWSGMVWSSDAPHSCRKATRKGSRAAHRGLSFVEMRASDSRWRPESAWLVLTHRYIRFRNVRRIIRCVGTYARWPGWPAPRPPFCWACRGASNGKDRDHATVRAPRRRSARGPSRAERSRQRLARPCLALHLLGKMRGRSAADPLLGNRHEKRRAQARRPQSGPECGDAASGGWQNECGAQAGPVSRGTQFSPGMGI